MITWQNEFENNAEGTFKSKFFRNDEHGYEFSICVNDIALKDCAEKCIDSFDNLPEKVIAEICQMLIECAQTEGAEEGFELPELDNKIDILKYCWFNNLYVDMAGENDEIAYVVEGEGDWGLPVGFVIRNNQVVYAGGDYLDYIQNV